MPSYPETHNNSLAWMRGWIEEPFKKIGKIRGASLDGDYVFGFGMQEFVVPVGYPGIDIGKHLEPPGLELRGRTELEV